MSIAKQLLERLIRLQESPYFIYDYNKPESENHNELADYIAHFTVQTIQRSYIQLFELGNGFIAFQKKSSTNPNIYVCRYSDNVRGHITEPLYIAVMRIEVEYPSFQPKGTKKLLQVGSVEVLKGHGDERLASKTYIKLLEKHTLISGFKHYAGGYRLWNSLSGYNNLYIYAYNVIKDDYLRNEDGSLFRYKKNTKFPEQIADPKIWGMQKDFHNRIVLVGSNKPIVA